MKYKEICKDEEKYKSSKNDKMRNYATSCVGRLTIIFMTLMDIFYNSVTVVTSVLHMKGTSILENVLGSWLVSHAFVFIVEVHLWVILMLLNVKRVTTRISSINGLFVIIDFIWKDKHKWRMKLKRKKNPKTLFSYLWI